MYLQLHILNLIFRNLQILFDNFELLQEIFSRRNILFFFRFVWVWKSIEYSLELRKKQNLGPAPSLLFGLWKNIFEKINTKGLQGGFWPTRNALFSSKFPKGLFGRKSGIGLGGEIWAPRPFPLIWKGMVHNLFVYKCVIFRNN